MADQQQTQFYIVDGAMLPEVFRKVTEAKSLLERGEASTVAEAVAQVGISRSAFYKYKGAVSPFRNMKVGRIITYHIVLRDKMGSLSELLTIFTNSGANILTINQSIPINGTAIVAISAEIQDMNQTNEALMSAVRQTPGVIKIEVLAG